MYMRNMVPEEDEEEPMYFYTILTVCVLYGIGTSMAFVRGIIKNLKYVQHELLGTSL